MKLFLDDERIPVDVTWIPRHSDIYQNSEWVVARSAIDAKLLVQKNGVPDFISFDHDLSLEDGDTGYEFAKWLVDFCLDTGYSGEINYVVHSQNPVGKANIVGLIENFRTFMGNT